MFKKKKRVSSLKNQTLQKINKTSKKIEIRFIGTSRCGKKVFANWFLKQYNGLAYYSDKDNEAIFNKDKFQGKYTEVLNNKKLIVNRKSEHQTSIGFGFNNKAIEPIINVPTNHIGFNVLVLRDPFNQFASIWKGYPKWYGKDLDVETFLTLKDLWMNHANYYLQSNKIWDGKTLRINYNTFITEVDYQKQILSYCKDFNYQEDVLKKITTNTPFTDNKVLKRKDEMHHSPIMRVPNRDNELQELSERIFHEC